jgi:hypothetical protein
MWFCLLGPLGLFSSLFGRCPLTALAAGQAPNEGRRPYFATGQN